MPKLLKHQTDHLYKRGKTWWVYYRTANGETIRESLGTQNREIAEQILKRYSIPGTKKLGAYPIDKAINDYITAKLASFDFTPSSARSTKNSCIVSARRSGVQHVHEIAPQSAQALYEHDDFKETSEATARTYSMRWRAFLVWLHQKNLISKYPLPVKFSKRRNLNQRKEIISFSTAQKIIDFTYTHENKEGEKIFNRDDLRYVCYCVMFLGLRRNEVVMSTPKWWDMRAREISIPAYEETTDLAGRQWIWRTKNKLARKIPVTAGMWAFLVAWLPDFFNPKPEATNYSPPPFMLHSNARGRGGQSYRWDPRAPFENLIKAFRKENPYLVPENFGMHQCRHSFISGLAEQGISALKIAMWSGDRIRTIEENYLHPLVKGNELDWITKSQFIEEK